jgi:hypothetical protein
MTSIKSEELKKEIEEIRKLLPKPLTWQYDAGLDAVIPFKNKNKPCSCITHLYSETQMISFFQKAIKQKLQEKK